MDQASTVAAALNHSEAVANRVYNIADKNAAIFQSVRFLDSVYDGSLKNRSTIVVENEKSTLNHDPVLVLDDGSSIIQNPNLSEIPLAMSESDRAMLSENDESSSLNSSDIVPNSQPGSLSTDEIRSSLMSHLSTL